MACAVDYTDQTFGELTAKEYTEIRNKDGKRLWRCECSCGGEKFVTAYQLKTGHVKSCGCQHRVSKVKVGDVFGFLKVKERLGSDKKGIAVFLCSCGCGKPACKKEKAYPSTWLRYGLVTSCKDFKILDLTNKVFGYITALQPTEKRASTNIMWECRCECGKIVYRTHANLKVSGKNANCGCLQSELSRENMRKVIHHVEDTCIEKIVSRSLPANNKSGVRGVYYNWRNQSWRAYIGFKKKQIYLGEYITLEAAAEVRRQAEQEIYEPFLREYYAAQSFEVAKKKVMKIREFYQSENQRQA